MKHFLIFFFFILVSLCSYSQSLLPKSLKIDFSDPKAPEYKKRYKEHKDSIQSLSKLNKKTLRVALTEFNKLPRAKKHKSKVKNLESDFRDYQSLINEVDSVKSFRQTVDKIKARESLGLRSSEEEIARAKRIHYHPIAEWLGQHQDEFQFSDSTLSFSERIKETIAQNQYGDIAWKELNTEPDVFLDDYHRYGKYWVNDEEWIGEMAGGSSSQKKDNVSSLADEHFGSYDNYLLAKSKANEISALLDEAKGYTQSIEALLKGDFRQADKVASALEARAMKIKAMRETSEKMGTLESSQQTVREQVEEMRYKADLQSQYEEHLKGKNKEMLTKEALMKSKGLASKHFEGHEDELAKAQKGLDKYKGGVFDFKNSNNIEVIKQNSLKGKPLSERLVIGGYLQINRNDDYTAVDLSPQIGYRWTKNYLWGIGGTYRFKLNESDLSVLREEEIYGGRYFMEYSIGKLFAHGEYELMSHAKVDPGTDVVRRIQSPGLLAGLGINYNFIKKVDGNMMVLYNFLHDPATSPYKQPFVFRFGFNLGK